jgi:hypothetical protein
MIDGTVQVIEDRYVLVEFGIIGGATALAGFHQYRAGAGGPGCLDIAQ